VVEIAVTPLRYGISPPSGVPDKDIVQHLRAQVTRAAQSDYLAAEPIRHAVARSFASLHCDANS